MTNFAKGMVLQPANSYLLKVRRYHLLENKPKGRKASNNPCPLTLKLQWEAVKLTENIKIKNALACLFL